MRNRIPPPILTVLICGLIWVAGKTWPQTVYAIPILGLFAVGLAVAGLAMLLWAGVLFKLTKTTVNPFKPKATSSIVATGPYKISRNPMYLGMGMLILSMGCYVGNLLAVPIFIVFKLYMDATQIKPEERALTEKFGQEYTAYMSQVRRWI